MVACQNHPAVEATTEVRLWAADDEGFETFTLCRECARVLVEAAGRVGRHVTEECLGERVSACPER
jgi:hypothetical protein